ncbi:oxidation resistance protein 1b isoform X3 [Alosa alosa]|uniref:oxidation resistance protein 1b isoform X3 n=1 Tax=Alosa alosa TaxID=278164 RepID=UPI002015311A|nr:oxidation resistance protein 1b isoform X3 [Alosa alosa]
MSAAMEPVLAALRLKKKSQSVDISEEGFAASLVKDPLASPIIRSIARATISEEQENNTTNVQKGRSPRRGELKRGYTIDTGQKKTERKDGRRMSFQRPKGTIEYSVESRDTLNSIALKFDTTPNELVQLNKLFSRAVVPGKVLYVPDQEYVSSAESSPSLSPISPHSPTSSEADLEKLTKDSNETHRRNVPPLPAHPLPRPVRVVSSTSEEEEALTEKFLKINCKYITDGKGVVSGVLLVTPNNIMFDPHKADGLVQERGCEEYGIMCPLEELVSAAMCSEITDSRMREFVPPDLELEPSVPEVSHVKRTGRGNADEVAQRLRDAGNDSASTAPRSTEASLSEDVFTESELSPSSDELQRHKSSDASSESVQTINQAEAGEDAGGAGPTEGAQMGRQSSRKDRSVEDSKHSSGAVAAGLDGSGKEPILPGDGARDGSRTPSESQSSDTMAADIPSSGQEVGSGSSAKLAPSAGKEELGDSHTMQPANEHKEGSQVTASQITPANPDGTEKGQGAEEGASEAKEKQKTRSHKFLSLRVGKAMRKTFVSHASASMQQYAQRDRKHEYWFAVPPERSDHLYSFFVQWTPDMYGESGVTREPGFVVVKKTAEKEEGQEKPAADITSKEWEVVSVAEYYRRIDALNSEDLRSLCKRLQITTKAEVNSKHGPCVKSEPEPEVFRTNLSEPSDLLQTEQIEKLAKNLPPRTIGYPWTLAFGTTKHGMSIKTLYRIMQGLDSPVLLVIKDSDGQVFGALASEPFKVSDGFYGTGETFLFTFCPDFEVFKWTGDNMFFMKGDMDSLAFGGGGGEFGLWLDGDLYRGRSHSCKTFGNPMLSKKEDFVVQDIEIWSFE